MDFYSMTGDVVCHLHTDQNFYLWNGKPVAYLAEDRVFGFNGRQLGRGFREWLVLRPQQPAVAVLGEAATRRSEKRPVPESTLRDDRHFRKRSFAEGRETGWPRETCPQFRMVACGGSRLLRSVMVARGG